MSTIRNPVGPLPRAVYWRRRLLLLLAVLAVIVVIVLIVVRPGSGEPSAAPTDTSTPAATDAATADPEADCDPAAIRVTPVTDALSYPEGVNPMVSMLIENVGATACTYDVGTGAQEYLITSGSDRIWSSADCQTDPTSTPLLLEPGDPKSTTAFPWDRTRSSTDTCGADRPAVDAGGASYHLEVRLGEAVSDGTVQFVLQ